MTKTHSLRSLSHLALGLSACMTGVATRAVADDEPKPDPKAWRSSAAIGATVTRGNSDTLMVNGTVASQKKWDSNEIGLGASVTYGEDSGKKNASAVTAFAQYNRLFTQRIYGLARVDFLHDGIAKVDYRISLNPGIGYYFIKNDRFTLAGEAGPGYVFERLDGADQDYLTLRFGERFTWQINKRARLWQLFDYQPRADEWSDYVMNAEVGVETDITKRATLRLAATDTYRSRPVAGRKENDFRLIAGVGYRF